MPKILIVEDGVEESEMLTEFATDLGYTVTGVSHEVPAYEAVIANPDFCLIAFDGFLKHGEFDHDTVNLIRSVTRRVGAGVVLVAMSSLKEMRQQQMQAGCNHELTDKMNFGQMLKELIKTGKIPAAAM